MTDIETKIERLEEKMMNDEIEPSTYKNGLIDTLGKNGMCRTPTINPAFAHNLLNIKAKRLLDIEQPLPDLSINPMCTETGKLIEHIYSFLMIVERILEKYEEQKLREKHE
ncbi:hypothetical protein ABID99_001051 [Mucilaginibacter sp. OAE612]|uniref:hypothetical protein n=1 Tax=Mucilaginibacter sp. OAE612 TaxID=3156444 RepID=UPI00359E78CC